MKKINGRLIQVVREVRDQMENILTEYEMLVDEVVQGITVEEGHGNAVPNDSNFEPEEGQPTPEGEVESVGSMIN